MAGLALHIRNPKPILFFGTLFCNGAMARAYARARHWFEDVFVALFGLAGVQILTMRLTQ